ncbi:MAG: DNA/RNA nuclease SfsA [Treponema sp.]|nr:DNA/RNA nuclease SfsA [Treponema sp.]
MKYEKTVSGIFIDRPNRFIAHVEIEGIVETVHVKNTGRCRELLVQGCTVILEDFRNRPGAENRKTKFDLIAVYKITDGHENSPLLINMDSQAPNKVVLEWLQGLPAEQSYTFIKPEFTFGNSRVDFYMEKEIDNRVQKFLMEVKGCTLEKNGTGFFPDAPTQRGVKHLHELAAAAQNGYNAMLAFVIQIPGVSIVLPNIETHPAFGEALEAAKAAGVQILYLQCDVKEDELVIKQI